VSYRTSKAGATRQRKACAPARLLSVRSCCSAKETAGRGCPPPRGVHWGDHCCRRRQLRQGLCGRRWAGRARAERPHGTAACCGSAADSAPGRMAGTAGEESCEYGLGGGQSAEDVRASATGKVVQFARACAAVEAGAGVRLQLLGPLFNSRLMQMSVAGVRMLTYPQDGDSWRPVKMRGDPPDGCTLQRRSLSI